MGSYLLVLLSWGSLMDADRFDCSRFDDGDGDPIERSLRDGSH